MNGDLKAAVQAMDRFGAALRALPSREREAIIAIDMAEHAARRRLKNPRRRR